MSFHDYDPYGEDVVNECPGCGGEDDCYCGEDDRYEDDFNGPMDSDYGDSESDHVWADLARSEAA